MLQTAITGKRVGGQFPVLIMNKLPISQTVAPQLILNMFGT